MLDFILLMHDYTTSQPTDDAWDYYFGVLNRLGAFNGGSSIGPGETLRKGGDPAPASDTLVGYIRVQAETLEAAKALVESNPHFDCGGTVEVRTLPRD